MGKTIRRILSVGLLWLLILIPLSPATEVQYMNLTFVGKILSDNITEQSSSFIFSGDSILWNNISAGGVLYLYSLTDNSTRLIAMSPGGMIMPDGYTMSDGTIVWSNDSNILHEYTIALGRDHIIPNTNTTGSQKTYFWNGFPGIQRWEPSVYGDRVVWFQGYPSGTYRKADIAFLNTTTDEMTLINESPSAKGGLQINGENVIWYAYDEDVTDTSGPATESSINLYNIVTGKDTVVCPEPGLKGQAALSGNYIGWTDFGNPLATPRPLWRVSIYTISSGTTQTVPSTSMDQNLDFIFGDYAVYTECPAYNAADKATNEESCQDKIFDIRTGSTWQILPSWTDQNIVGYSDGLFLVEDTRGDTPALSLFRADNLPPADTTTATPAPAMPENNVTSPAGTTLSVPPVAGTRPTPTRASLSALIPVTGVSAVCLALGASRKVKRL
jgi:hypothetical protein